MKASILDLRRRMKDILLALDRNESVTILYRGKEKAILSPSRQQIKKPVKDHEAGWDVARQKRYSGCRCLCSQFEKRPLE